MTVERFIPYKKFDIIKMCSAYLNASKHDEEVFEEFSQILSSTIHVNYHQILEQLKYDYTPFEPNSDTRNSTPFTKIEIKQYRKSFAENFSKVLDAANFEKVTEQDLQDALTEESLFKVRLNVEFDDFEQVVFYRRGELVKSEIITSWFGLRKQTLNFTNYSRVAIYITFKDKEHFIKKKKLPVGYEPGATIIKLFQNVPKADLEMLFPNSEVTMRTIDKVIISGSALIGGIAVLVTKLGASLLLLSALLLFSLGFRDEPVTMTQQHFISFALGCGIFGSFIFKEWNKFKNRKIKFMKALSDNLYFKNLDNNAGVFHTLIDAAEEEDFKEAILAYTFLLRNKAPLTAQALDKKIEHWFLEYYQCQLDFEISDALAKLVTMKLVEESNSTFQALSLDKAKQTLDSTWDNVFNYHQVSC